MVSDYINGYDYPVFHLLDSNGIYIKAVELPRCTMDGGEIETAEFEMLTCKTIDGEIKQLPLGIRQNWELNYQTFVAVTAQKIAEILMWWWAGNILHLRPHGEERRSYDVLYSGEAISMKNTAGLEDSIMEGLKLKFITRELQTNLNWDVPAIVSGLMRSDSGDVSMGNGDHTIMGLTL